MILRIAWVAKFRMIEWVSQSSTPKDTWLVCSSKTTSTRFSKHVDVDVVVVAVVVVAVVVVVTIYV